MLPTVVPISPRFAMHVQINHFFPSQSKEIVQKREVLVNLYLGKGDKDGRCGRRTHAPYVQRYASLQPRSCIPVAGGRWNSEDMWIIIYVRSGLNFTHNEVEKVLRVILFISNYFKAKRIDLDESITNGYEAGDWSMAEFQTWTSCLPNPN